MVIAVQWGEVPIRCVGVLLVACRKTGAGVADWRNEDGGLCAAVVEGIFTSLDAVVGTHAVVNMGGGRVWLWDGGR